MRSWVGLLGFGVITVITVVGVGVGLSACSSEDPAPVFLRMDYQMRCVDCTPRTTDDPVHRISALDGEDGYGISCQVTGSDKKSLKLVVQHTSPTFQLSIDHATIDAVQGAACRVQVVEGGNTYAAVCSSDSPSIATPCKLELGTKDGDLTGTLYCNDIANSADNTSTRDLVAPMTTSDPVEFSLQGCL